MYCKLLKYSYSKTSSKHLIETFCIVNVSPIVLNDDGTEFNRNILYCKLAQKLLGMQGTVDLIETFCIVNYKDCNDGIDWYDI